MSLILSGTNGLSDVDGSAATPAIRGTDANTGIFFPAADTIAFSEGGVEAMRIDSSGNVGIGTSSPVDKVSLYSATSVYQRFQNSTTGTGAADGFQIGNDSSGAYVWNYEAEPLIFATSGTERARITSGGNLLVGTTTNTRTAKFRVYKSGDNVMETETDNTGSGYIHIGFINPNGRVGAISTTGSATAYSTSSDYRLKENITPMTGALAKVIALKPVTYKWKIDGETSEGFIAHELAEVVPQCVTGEKDAVDDEGKPIYQGIDTSFLIATLTAAIQEQQALITTLTDRITALEAKP